MEKYEEAIINYDIVITLDNNAATAYNNKGICLFKLKKYKDAIENYTIAQELEPNYLDVYINKGTCYKTLNKIFDAIEQFDKALEIKEDYALAYYNKGLAYKTLKGEDNLNKALEMFNLAIKYQDDYYNAYFNKGCILIELDEYVEAINAFNKCKQLKEEDEECIQECDNKINECVEKSRQKGYDINIKYEEVSEKNSDK